MRRSRAMHADELVSPEMPLRQYFLLVGGGLLMLLLIVGVFPQPKERTESGPSFPVIRITSELKTPPAVVIDTSQHLIAPEASAEANVNSETAPIVEAEFRISESVTQSVALPQRQVGAGEPKKRSVHNPQSKRKRFAARTKHPPIQVAQRTNFGWLDTSW